jgi:hypothetical protein
MKTFEDDETDLRKQAISIVAARRAAALEEEVEAELQALRNRATLAVVAERIHERDLRQREEREESN